MARLLGGCCILLAVVMLVAAAAASARADDERSSGGARIRQPSGEWRGRKVGARMEVRDAEGDEVVQELGRFSVAEYNRRRGGGSRLEFARVVAAQRQVVAGLKYYLRVAAAEEEGGAENCGSGEGGERVFDAVVVVKPWLESRTLLRFAPAGPKWV